MDSALYELMEGDPEDEVRALMRLRDAEALPSGVRVVTLFGEVATIRRKRGAILQTRADESIRSLKAPRFLGPEPDPELYVEAEPPVPRDQRRPASLPETGQGVVLGVVDCGIDFRHEAFRHQDGTARLLAIWDKRGGRRADSPEPYGYGAVHTADEINRALQSGSPYQALGYHPLDADLDGNGTHGTHVMSI